MGESYAGKYIPDLAIKIKNFNAINPDRKIDLRGILLGNPAINFMEGSLEDN
jgi:carboxypeptidase C (cathepsin A)